MYAFTAANHSFSVQLPAKPVTTPIPVPFQGKLVGARGEVVEAEDGSDLVALSHLTFRKGYRLDDPAAWMRTLLANDVARLHGHLESYAVHPLGPFLGADALVETPSRGFAFHFRLVYNGRDFITLAANNVGIFTTVVRTLEVRPGAADIDVPAAGSA